MTKTDFDNNVISLDNKIAANETKNESIKNEFKKLNTFHSSYFIGKSHSEEVGKQNHLVFQPLNKYFKIIANKKYISAWQSKGLSDETVKPSATSDNSFTPLIDYLGKKRRAKFTGNCLKQTNISYNCWTIIKIHTVYELGVSSSHNNDPTLKNCLFGAVTLTKNADIDNYGYSGYGIWFDRRLSFSFPGGKLGQNVLMIGMSSSVHVDNNKKTF